MKTIYLIRHSGPFIKLFNYENHPFEDQSRNMILSIEGEENAKKLQNINELRQIDEIYSSNSARAIGTAKYLSEINNLEIKIENEINERVFGIKLIKELPKGFVEKQFQDKNYKLDDGESLFEVDKRFNDVIGAILQGDSEKVVMVIHGIVLMSYLSSIANVEFKNKVFNVDYNGKNIFNGSMKNPDVYKVVYDEDRVIDLIHIDIT